MILKKLIVLLTISLLTIGNFYGQRATHTINDAWRFHKGDISNAELMNANDSWWQDVSIPHTWNAFDAVDEVSGYYRGVGWYRKKINITQQGKQIYIYFEGANQETELFVNGKSAGKHRGGYGRFCFDITNFVIQGENLFAIKVDNSHNPDIAPLSADFTFFGGIYRDLYLVYTNKTHISTTHYASKGVYITTPLVNASKAEVNIRVLVDNTDNKAVTIKLKNVITDPNGKQVAVKISDVKLSPSSAQEIIQTKIPINQPLLWDTQTPHLYKVYTSILDAKGNELDVVTNPLGIRWFSFDPQKGFSLNGKYLKLIGTNRHQDYYKKGNALSDEMHIKDVRLLKEMGGNFLRVSHYPQDPVVMEMCDKLGILTSVEIPVVNAITDSEAFNNNCIETTREMIYQSFNSPSVIIWAYMNEVMLRPPYNKEDKTAEQVYFKAVEQIGSNIENEIRKIDPLRYTMIPCHGNANIYQAAGLAKLPMILGWNLYQGWYSGNFSGFDKQVDEIHERFPQQSMIITEYGADVDVRLHSFEPERFDFTAEYGDLYHEHYLKAIMQRPFISGANIWNLNDFQSEIRRDAVPHINSKGITDLERRPKDSYVLYKARFNPSPMVRIGKHDWIVRGGVADANYHCTQPVKVYSNGMEVELIVNGKYLGKSPVKDNIAKFDVPFVNGQNSMEASAVINGISVRDVLTVDFRMVSADLKDTRLPFNELNMMLGSKRYFEDKIASMIWLPEREYTPGSWGYVGGEAVRTKTRHGLHPAADVDVLGTDNDPIFQTQRKNIEALRFDVPDGEYAIYLYFAELVSGKEKEALVYNLGSDSEKMVAEDRSFNIVINGKQMLNGLNLAEQFGEERAVIQKCIITARNDEGITLNFNKITGDPVANAIRIYKIY